VAFVKDDVEIEKNGGNPAPRERRSLAADINLFHELYTRAGSGKLNSGKSVRIIQNGGKSLEHLPRC
jgi:hypothetical protein